MQLEYKEMDDWYNVTKEDIHKYGGFGLLYKYYNDSPSKALQSVYPNHKWMLWRFGRSPRGFRKNLRNTPAEQQNVIDWLNKNLPIRELDDWYRVSITEIEKHVPVIK